MARKKKKSGLVQKVLVIGGVLIIFQVAFIFYFQQATNPTDIRDVISAKVDAQAGLSSDRREQMKVQLALHDYRLTNGKFPATLNELIPKYFERIPTDPTTGQPFTYTVEGERFYLGEKASVKPASAAGSASAPGEGGATEEQEQDALIASLDAPQTVAFVYDPTDKRDPFRPFDFSVDTKGDCEAEPLSCWDIGQLRLAVVMSEGSDAKAVVETARGRGYIIHKGTKIGRNNGEVVEILPDRVKILEVTTDFTGESKTNVVEMMLRTKDQQPGTAPAGQSRGGKQRRVIP